MSKKLKRTNSKQDSLAVQIFKLVLERPTPVTCIGSVLVDRSRVELLKTAPVTCIGSVLVDRSSVE